jgi:ribosomal protein S18 acetylase RimI-like enzyme
VASTARIQYRIKSADAATIEAHLTDCAAAFIPPLHDRVDIGAYAHKIHARAVTIEAWENQSLVGLVAAYLNDVDSRSGFITSVSVAAEVVGRGVAKELLRHCIAHATTLGFRNIQLETAPNNPRALRLYREVGFRELERRTDSVVMTLSLEQPRAADTDA